MMRTALYARSKLYNKLRSPTLDKHSPGKTAMRGTSQRHRQRTNFLMVTTPSRIEQPPTFTKTLEPDPSR